MAAGHSKWCCGFLPCFACSGQSICALHKGSMGKEEANLYEVGVDAPRVVTQCSICLHILQYDRRQAILL